MEKFTTPHRHRRPAAPQSNVDTDQIIPAVYLKRVTRTGFEDALFAAWRKDPAFILNQDAVQRRLGAGRRPRLRHRLLPRARRLGAEGLRLQGRALAPASRTSSAATPASRACWPRRSAQEDIELIWKELENAARAPRSPSTSSPRTVTCGDIVVPFEIDDYTRWRLLEGLDDIGLTLQHADEITAFEAGPSEPGSRRRCPPSRSVRQRHRTALPATCRAGPVCLLPRIPGAFRGPSQS